MGDNHNCFTFCPKSRQPRIFITFCVIFSICIGVMSSLFFYYPDGLNLPVFSGGGANSKSSKKLVNSYEEVSSNHHDDHTNFKGSSRNHLRTHGNGDVDHEFDNGNIDAIFVEYNDDASPLASQDINGALDRNGDHSVPGEEKIRHSAHHNLHSYHRAGSKLITWTLEELEQKSNFSKVIESRLIHLDLKGAPPKVSFIKDVLKLAKLSGITGLLIEWEDTFPWKDNLTNLSLVKGGYSRDEAEEIINYAERNLELEVIPLVQTFGHLEFVLKGKEYSHLREIDEDPQAICPSKIGTLPLLHNMIDQTLELHKNSKFVHIGCDEVYNLRMCALCTSLSESRDDLFLSHVTKVAKYVRSKGRIPIIWDDMLRNIPLVKMRESNIASLVEPMVWVYAEDVDRFVGWESWEKYSAIFPTVWAAAAFKGAFGETLTIPPLSRHVDNVQRWIDVISRESPKWEKGVGGLVLTGWQRYDHFAVLCELLPAAIPSMVYTSLVLSTPGGGNSIRNRILVPKPEYLTTLPPPSSTTTTELPSTSTYSSSQPVSSSGHLPSNDIEDERIILAKRSAPVEIQGPVLRRRIPHPRSLMAKEKGEELSKFSGGKRGPGNELTSPMEKQEKVSRQFIQLLRCPNHHQDIHSLLKDIDSELAFAARCNFPGVAFFRTLFRLRSLLTEIWDLDTKISRKRAWVTPYNIRHNYSLPLRVDEVVFAQVPRLRRNIVVTAKSVGNSLKIVFKGDVILEWIEQNIWEAWKALDHIEKAGNALKSVSVWPRRPIMSPPKMIHDLGLNTISLDEKEEL